MIDPQAQAVLDELRAGATPMPADQDSWLRGYREELDQIVSMQGSPPACTLTDGCTSGGDGQPLGLRLYRADGPEPRPTLLFIHGGGFVAGSLAGYDVPLRHLALRSGWQIAAVDYRLAPEHPFPAATGDCMAALRHLLADGAVDGRHVAVGGDSAGGLLAAVLAQRARDAGIALALQLLLYPNADLREGAHHASRGQFDGTVVRIDELYRGLDLYCLGHDRADADLSPLLAGDLAGLCPALLVTCENDPLRDEAEAYGRRLREADVTLEAVRLGGMIHSVVQRGARIAAGDRLITRLAEALRAIVRH